MRVTLDLDRLLSEGKITGAEYEKFSAFASHSTRHLVFDVLIGFGVVAVSAALLTLFPTPGAAMGLGAAIGAAGAAGLAGAGERWRTLANICLIVGALLLAGGLIVADNGSVAAFFASAAVFAAGSVFARSSLLMALSVLALASCLGTRTDYFHAAYFLGVEEPALTIGAFSALAILSYWIGRRLSPDWQGLAVTAARTSVFLVNFGFWIGSLWGDRLGRADVAAVPAWAFSAAWALALIGAAIWAWRANRRWLVNVAAAFGAIHFYTQWFETLGASPYSMLAAGLIALGLAVGLSFLNLRWVKAES